MTSLLDQRCPRGMFCVHEPPCPGAANQPEPAIDERELAVACTTCNAKPGERCASLVDASKYRETVHAERRVLAQKGSS